MEDVLSIEDTGLWTEEDMQDYIDPSILLDEDDDDSLSESGSEQV